MNSEIDKVPMMGELLYLLEQTSTEDDRRRFWNGAMFGWDAMKAARYPEKYAAEDVCFILNGRNGQSMPPAHGRAEVCEHMFQCDAALPASQPGAAMPVAWQLLRSDGTPADWIRLSPPIDEVEAWRVLYAAPQDHPAWLAASGHDQRPEADERMVGGKTNAEPLPAEGHPIATQGEPDERKMCECADNKCFGGVHVICRMYEGAPLPDAPPADPSSAHLIERLTFYAASGGLWNPESMEHDKVRDLLLDCRDHIAALERELAEVTAARNASNHANGRLATLADKYKWQVRDTCARAEKAERVLAGVRADAERYRFLRSPLAAEGGPVQRELWNEMGVKLCREEAMDREVDAAMRLLDAARQQEGP